MKWSILHRRVLLPAFLYVATVTACITPGYVGFYWNQAVPMQVYVDPSVSNSLATGPATAPADQIQAAITIWNNYFQAHGYSFSIQTTTDSTQANVTINAANLSATNPSAGAVQDPESGAISSRTITINTNPVFPANSPLSGQPVMDPNQGGYQTYFAKIMLHEFGHVFGLADVYNNCQAAQSIEDQICGVNDSAQGIPLAITDCDNNEEQILEPPISSDPCAHVSCSCPGGGISCCKNPACCSVIPIDPTIGGEALSKPKPLEPLTVIPTPTDRCTPIILDLTGKGFKLGDAEEGVDFDILSDGQKLRIPWPTRNSGNAWLVLDRNGNGIIDDSSEMFGNLTPQPPSTNPNGFLALAQYDRPEQGGNNDGVIDSQDQIFKSLRLWVDKNHNGRSEPNELITLQEAGVEGISLSYDASPLIDKNGNLLRFRGTILVAPSSKVSPTTFDVILVNTPRKQE